MSHADGYFDLNVVVPLELEEIAVHQGPVSVLQGNFNRAGLVSCARGAVVHTKKWRCKQAAMAPWMHKLPWGCDWMTPTSCFWRHNMPVRMVHAPRLPMTAVP